MARGENFQDFFFGGSGLLSFEEKLDKFGLRPDKGDYNSQRAKKEAECEAVNHFLEAYEDVTGECIEVIKVLERPDFICSREDGTNIGIELVKVRRGHPDYIFWDSIIEKRQYMTVDDALNMLERIANEKETKRQQSNWRFTDATILLIQLVDIPLNDLQMLLSPTFVPFLYGNGFAEVWLVDFTGIEAFGNVETFCVKPEVWAGHHPRQMQKPYG